MIPRLYFELFAGFLAAITAPWLGLVAALREPIYRITTAPAEAPHEHYVTLHVDGRAVNTIKVICTDPSSAYFNDPDYSRPRVIQGGKK